MFLCSARYDRVTSCEPSRIIKCTVIKLLNTTVHVESRSRFCKERKTSATPASPECVAIRMCSIYFVFGGAAYSGQLVVTHMAPLLHLLRSGDILTLIFVAPLTDFSKELAMLSSLCASGALGRHGAGVEDAVAGGRSWLLRTSKLVYSIGRHDCIMEEQRVSLMRARNNCCVGVVWEYELELNQCSRPAAWLRPLQQRMTMRAGDSVFS